MDRRLPCVLLGLAMLSAATAYPDVWNSYAGATCAHPDNTKEHAGHEGALIDATAMAAFVVSEVGGGLATKMCPGRSYSIKLDLPKLGGSQEEPHIYLTSSAGSFSKVTGDIVADCTGGGSKRASAYASTSFTSTLKLRCTDGDPVKLFLTFAVRSGVFHQASLTMPMDLTSPPAPTRVPADDTRARMEADLTATVAHLIAAGADVNARISLGATPLYFAAMGSPSLSDADGRGTLAAIGPYQGAIDALLAAGACPAAAEFRGKTPVAAATASAAELRATAARLAPGPAREALRMAAAYEAAARQLEEAAAGLPRQAPWPAEGGPADPRNAQLISAAADGDVTTVERLLAQPRADPNAVIQLLLAAGARVDVRTPGAAMTPLWMAAEGGHAEAVRVLLEAGADPAARDREEGMTTLHAAARAGSAPAATALLAHPRGGGALAAARDKKGRTPLHIAAVAGCEGDRGFDRGNGVMMYMSSGVAPGPGPDPALVGLLLAAGADPATRDYRGCSALDAARGGLRADDAIRRGPGRGAISPQFQEAMRWRDANGGGGGSPYIDPLSAPARAALAAVAAQLEAAAGTGAAAAGGAAAGGSQAAAPTGGRAPRQGVGGAKLRKCGGCHQRRYCGQECQAQDWKAGHKHQCPGRTGGGSGR
ncbi:MAG: hypothetical protein J3K34DRAFT_524514 [Monoraphidium minutum]|nr:MAG: hypothetical protein J3K34DRAFT_524514 [Monoraphidium minutum]